MPLVQKIQKDIEGRSDVMIVAHNAGVDSKDEISKYFKDSGFTFTPIIDAGDKGGDSRMMGVAAYPTNIVIGPDGKVLHASVGFNETLIRKLLGAPAKG